MTTPRMDGPAWAMLVLLSVLWGGSFVLTEVILTAVPVFTTVAARVAIAATTLLLVLVALREPLPRGRVWGMFFVMGVFANAVPFCLIVWGQTHLTGGLAAVLNATTPIFTGILAGLVLPDERLTPHKLIGLMIGLAGVAVVIGPGALGNLGADILAELAALGAALAYAVSTVYARRFARLGVKPVAVAFGQTVASTTLLVPLALVHDAPWTLPVPGAGVLAALLVFGCLCTAAAYILFYAILARAGTNVVLVTVLVPAVAVGVGAALLGEPVETGQIAGMALIAFALAVVDGRLWARLSRRRASASAGG